MSSIQFLLGRRRILATSYFGIYCSNVVMCVVYRVMSSGQLRGGRRVYTMSTGLLSGLGRQRRVQTVSRRAQYDFHCRSQRQRMQTSVVLFNMC